MSKIQINSVLDMPLDASIRLLLNEDESQHQYTVKLASSADYQKVGLDKSFVPSNIQVSVDEDDPSLVNISSLGPISNPIVSLLLDVSWSNGRLLREFTILLDPPVYTSSSSPQFNDISTPENTTVETTPGDNDVLEDNYVEEAKVKSTKLVAYDDVSSEVFVSGG
ncbi:MAG: hypothetical protein L3J52_09810, partial [Proteobacteria bacterium]|nr:hypothetical protein [Pseudomonadota bacterium]